MKFEGLRTILAVFLLGFGSLLRAQDVEIEPNQPCSLAQDVGLVSLPFTMNGSLDPAPGEGDVDFYSFEGLPSTGVRIDLEGVPTGKGTLDDPFLGFFDSGCNLILLNDDNGETANSRLELTVPADGLFILAATSCCDYLFQGNVGVSGSYQLTISPQAFAGSISGRVLDGRTGDPLPGNDFPFAFVELFRCTIGECAEHVGSQSADSGGRFRFDAASLGTELTTGTYQVRIAAETYVEIRVGPFDVGEGEDVDLGDTYLAPLPRAGGVSGRLVDSAYGFPLAGDTNPFARVELARCDDSGCPELVAIENTDNQGRFRFERAFGDRPLLAGIYQVRASAEDYEPHETALFFVAEAEFVDLGDLALAPFPIGFSQVNPCGDLPPQGGLCIFSVLLTNRLAEPVEGAVWSLVRASDIGSVTDSTLFQAGSARRVALPPGGSRLVFFAFVVPSTVRNGSNSCVESFFGDNALIPFFNTVGHRDLFCIQKGFTGDLRVLSEKQSQRVLREVEKGTRPRRKDE